MECTYDWECQCQTKYHGVQSARDLFTTENFKKFEKPWESKINTAFFRGTATGGGTTLETNQRLHLAHLSHSWKKSSQYMTTSNPAVPFLDAHVTAWNLRDKKIAGTPVTFLRKNTMEFSAGKQHYIPMYDQSKFKYILYVEGHCAANRYGFLMRLGSVILKVTSKCVASEMWYFPLLKPFVDHVPIKADLSDLEEQLRWCHEHDEECRTMAANAAALYDQYVSKEAIRDYLEMIFTTMASNYVHVPPIVPPAFYVPPQAPMSPPRRKPQGQHHNNNNRHYNGCLRDGSLCLRCTEREHVDKSVAPPASSASSSRSSMISSRGSYNPSYASVRSYQHSSPKKSKEKGCKKCRRGLSKCKCTI